METGQHHKRFLVVAAASFLVLSVGLAVTFWGLLDTRTRETQARCSAAAYKREIGKEMTSPKVVIIAGSNTVSGISAEMVSGALQLPVLNMGLFAGLGPRILFAQAEQVLQPGDTALLVLEYNSYTFDQPTPPTIDFVLGCDRAMFDQLPLGQKISYIFALDGTRIMDTIRNGRRVKSDAGDAAARPRSLTPFGDKALNLRFFPPLSPAERERMALYKPTPIDLNPAADGVASIREFVVWARSNRIRVIATWPNTIYFPSYETNPGFDAIARFYDDLGVPVVGSPAISWFPASQFYDTQYHLGIEGIVQRTRMLIPILKQTLDAPDPKAAGG